MAFTELKARQSVVWGNGPYERITNTIRDIHDLVIERVDPKPGERVLDAATGTGAVAILAAERGADVVGQDIAPVLIETARERAAAGGRQRPVRGRRRRGDDIRRRELRRRDVDLRGDVRARPRGGRSRAARVTKPGGRLALACWTPEAGSAEMFKMMGPFLPPPVPGAGSPFAWGDEDHVRELLGDTFELEFEEHDSPLAVAVRRGVLGALLHLVRTDEDRRRGTRRRSAARSSTRPGSSSSKTGIARATRSSTTASTSSRSARADSRAALGE